MPAHVINEVLLHDIKLSDCAQYLFDKNGALSFEVLVPLPINLWRGGCGRRLLEVFVGNTLDAARDMWGTKWNACGNPFAGEVPGGTVLRFKTAWNPPRGWICALFNTLACDITSHWLCEGERFVHVETYKQVGAWDEPTWEESILGPDSAEYLSLYGLLFNGLPPFFDEEDWVEEESVEGEGIEDVDETALEATPS
ncbi:hypothetical protein SAMN05880582_10823 [Rhizobium sp. RU20A]|uniref:hypothetical protein n=1 Tax=Rhizobium sp. RU20A TaxID=1907412 RepID=UPI000954467F|nr:hypothetical protein [Rhizobium sp. RU20A]SIR21605.1 hypothetical protein SAMN05880582_10823 [Rhizobium sp. RU20A]